MEKEQCLQLEVEILKEQHRCEMAGIGACPEEPIVETERVMQVKQSMLPGDPEEHVFSLVYLDAMQNCRRELEGLFEMIDQFNSSYLGALKHHETHSDLNNWVAPQIVKRKTPTGEEVVSIYQEPRNKRRRKNFEKGSTEVLKRWIFEHLFHPYPTGLC
jgi:hypothetical protein